MPRWEKVTGLELEERIALDRPLDDLLPSGPAVYMWRRNLRLSPAATTSASAFQAWLGKVMRVPIATLKKKELSHYSILEKLSLGGQGLSADKENTLGELAKNAKARVYLAGYVESLAMALPSLYVGEAHNLTVRIRDHINGDSGLKSLLIEDFELGWPDVELWYFVLPLDDDSEKPKSLRTLFEAIATRLTLAPCVRRIG